MASSEHPTRTSRPSALSATPQRDACAVVTAERPASLYPKSTIAYSSILLSRAEFVITERLDVNIATTAMTGCNSPKNAIGIASVL